VGRTRRGNYKLRSISVAMATFNGAEFLRSQLDSLAVQTRLPLEVVISDDCSTDGTLEIAASFAKAAPFPVRIYENQVNLGYRANFMRAASLSRGELVAFCDQDDVWLADKLTKCAEAFEQPGAMLVFHDANVVDAEDRFIRRMGSAATRNRVNPPNSVAPMTFSLGFTQVFDRSLLEYVAYWSQTIDHFHPMEPMAHDQFFFFLASVLGNIVYLDEALVSYRQHRSNLFGDAQQQKMSILQYLAWDRIPDFSALAFAAGNRSEFLRRIRRTASKEASERIEGGLLRSEAFKEHYQLRVAIHNDARFGKRFGAFLALFRKCGYRTGGDDLKGTKNAFYDGIGGVGRVGPFLRGLKPLKGAGEYVRTRLRR
jgi:glycosyltransferase involved in cell wall biosynthesis